MASDTTAAPRRRTRPLVAIALLVACAAAGLLAVLALRSTADLSFSRHLLSNARYRWSASQIRHYRLVVEQPAGDGAAETGAGVCRRDIEVQDGVVLAEGPTSCPPAPALTIPDLFAAVEGLLSDEQRARSASVRGVAYNGRPAIENVLTLPCGAGEAANYRVEIVYDQDAGYPQLIHPSRSPLSPAESIATRLGLLPRCSGAMGTLPELRVVALEELP